MIVSAKTGLACIENDAGYGSGITGYAGKFRC